ncbi:MAG TPA: cytochrome c oxidase subunit I [Acidimicrobiales bacterium]|jgi:cytochrome c oxidase subunit 1|nr:cytochrome c oxidase subunit I [Acidimicrobiales bacterium]
MTIVTDPPARPPVATPPDQPIRLLRRPTGYTKGIWSWVTTVDHKKIGIMYGVTAFVFFLLGGIEALMLRIQLGSPNNTFLSADTYNQVFTMHGTTMIFLFVMPLSAAFANYLIPIQIGARDVAFPRLNAFGYWVFLVGGLFMYSSFILGGAPNGGWFGYAPNTLKLYNPGHNIDFWVFGLQILGIASLTGAVNLIVTAINMRAPGMSLFRMPIFTWMSLVAQFLLLFAIPVITVALFLLMFDRTFGANFFNAQAGSDPLLWQHLFWLFGHPEVYILILPAMGIVSEVIPVFARKPLFGYQVMVFSGIAIGFMGWGVWAHHMFATGLGPVATSAFSASTMFIAVPTGVKIFNWLATMWRGKIKTNAPMLFAVGFVAMFTIGGLSGVTHGVVPADTQQTDTYYVVAHFHYVLFGGSVFGLFAGIFYWYPKVVGHMLSDTLGKIQFWLFLIGFNMTFGPFHILGLEGMPRRIYTYPSHRGWDFWNMISTIGSFVIAAAVLLFIYNVWSSRKNPKVGNDPWDARTLEWSIPSPPPEYNFAEVPLVTARDDLWHRKYTEDENGRTIPRHPADAPAEAETEAVVRAAVTDDPSGDGDGSGADANQGDAAHDGDAHDGDPARDGDARDGDGDSHDGDAGGHEEHEPHVHMPSPSYWPAFSSIGLAVISYGMIYRVWVVAILGGLWVLGGLYAWSLEPATAPEEPELDTEPSTDLEPVGVGPAGTAAGSGGSD